MNHKEIAAIFHEISQLLELKGENEFRIKAYQRASFAIKATENLDELAAQGALTKIPALGKGTVAIVEELLQIGRSTFLEELSLSIPEGVRAMLQLAGLGPKKVRRLWHELGIESIGELEYACHENRLKQLSGFGEKTQQQVLQSIQFLKQNQDMHLFAELFALAQPVLTDLRAKSMVRRVELAGELRRLCPLVSEVHLVVDAEPSLFDIIANLGAVVARESWSISVQLSARVVLRVWRVEPQQFGFYWAKQTASALHWEQLGQRSSALGLSLEEDGLYQAGQRLSCPEEETLFAALGLAMIPAPLREGLGEIEAASTQTTFSLIVPEQVRGILHSHSTWSDGTASIEEMARQAQARGYSYLQISDHSQAAHYAGGLSAERLFAQSQEIDALQKQLTGIKLLKGIEVDIMADGTLDLDGDTLSRLDVVIASVHMRFKQTKDEMTARLVRAVQSPHVDILGHPTGRLLLSRAPYELDFEQVFTAAAQANTAIEINANPQRLDLDWERLQLAKKLGVRLCISPDAHSVTGLEHTFFGVCVAQKGGLSADDIWNTQEAEAFLAGRK
jgi:DNA polymerase (family X)